MAESIKRHLDPASEEALEALAKTLDANGR